MTRSLKQFHHFTDCKTAAFFADTLESTLKNATYTDRTRCACCGKALNKFEELYRLDNGSYMHKRCFFRLNRAQGNKELLPHTYVPASSVPDKNAKDFSNLEQSHRERFYFSIDAISKEMIHLCVKDSFSERKNNFYLSYEQCIELVSEIREKLQAIEKAKLGCCCHCKKAVYADQDSFLLMDDVLLHAKCLESFILSEKASSAQLPAKKLFGQDVFGRKRYW